MATCEVDVEPGSIAGVTCGRLIRDGRCPIHGYQTYPLVTARVDIVVEDALRKIDEIMQIIKRKL